jgi:predicted transcriptional regulator
MGKSSSVATNNTKYEAKLRQASAERRSVRDRDTQLNKISLHSEVLAMTVEVVTAHFLKNVFLASDFPALLEKVNRALISLDASRTLTKEHLVPAVPINESVTDDYIICLEDGKRMKMLKGHLRVFFNLTPEQYRNRWGLPADYPMVAADYARRRSLIAKKKRLGRKKTMRWKAVDQMESPEISVNGTGKKSPVVLVHEGDGTRTLQKKRGKSLVVRKRKKDEAMQGRQGY